MKNMNKEDLCRWTGTCIYQERTSKRLSQEALAESVNVSRVFISQLENGNRFASIYTYYRIAKALDISLSELFCGDENDAVLGDIRFILIDSTPDETRAYIDIIRFMKTRLEPFLEP